MTPSPRRIAHTRTIAAVATVGLMASWVVAVRRPVPHPELRATEAINAVPDAVAVALYPVMQLGTVWAPLVVAAAIWLLARDGRLAVAVVLAGVVAWFGAKAVKALVERGRPLAYVPGIDVREGTGTGLGFVSGHAAVAAATAVVGVGALPPRWRPLAALAAGLVGLARIVHGVHLPADVVGGWSAGALVGLASIALVDAVAGRGARA